MWYWIINFDIIYFNSDYIAVFIMSDWKWIYTKVKITTILLKIFRKSFASCTLSLHSYTQKSFGLNTCTTCSLGNVILYFNNYSPISIIYIRWLLYHYINNTCLNIFILFWKLSILCCKLINLEASLSSRSLV